jgi:periplasmic divalent cation tolerance protein
MTAVPDVLICVTTLPDRAAAERLAENLVRDGLAACAQVGADLTSFYRWQGALCRDAEVAVTLKVTATRWEACARRLRAEHPYDVPQIVAWRADRVDADYARWVGGEPV